MIKVFLISLFFCSILSAQEIKLTLEESLRLGLENSKELFISRAQIESADANRKEISSSLFPGISLNAKYTRLSDVPPFEVELPILPQPFTIQESYLNNYNLIATVEQPIFTGFRLSSMLSAAEYIEEAEKTGYLGKRIEVADNIYASFWKFYVSEQILKTIEQNLLLLNSHLHNTEIMLENGLVTKNDYLKLKVEVGNAELRLIDSRNKYNLSRAAFNKSIGLNINAETEILVDTVEVENLDLNLDELFYQAENERTELKSSKLLLSSLREKTTAAKSDFYPQLYAFGNYYYNNPNQRFLPLKDKFNNSWDVGVALKWKIWNWGMTSAKVEKAQKDYLKAENNLKLINENILMEVYDKYLKLKEAIKKIDLSKLQLISANENYRITEEKYYQQLATTTELIDSETLLLNAKITLMNSKIEYKIGLNALKKSVGKETDL